MLRLVIMQKLFRGMRLIPQRKYPISASSHLKNKTAAEPGFSLPIFLLPGITVQSLSPLSYLPPLQLQGFQNPYTMITRRVTLSNFTGLRPIPTIRI